ncbi:hypothetical protein GCM10009765_76680 [Fodinicola feengrottensis]|uniref:Uncharacterized protein n=1 Tax=Fodinicola feengrottensis TaxID=435914 RepID=A0ABN2J390_9ACTN
MCAHADEKSGIAKLQKRVRQRLPGTYGVFLTMSGYSPEALADLAYGDRVHAAGEVVRVGRGTGAQL